MERNGLGQDQRFYSIMIHRLYGKGRIQGALCFFNAMALKGMVPEPRRKISVYDMNVKLKESRQKEETVLSNKDG